MSAKEGWWRSPFAPANAKYHFYKEDRRSLCGKYFLFGGEDRIHEDIEGYFIGASDSCKTCSKKLAERLEEENEARNKN